MSVLSGLGAFFFGLALFAGNAFDRVSPVPADGPGPNPLLQDHPLMGVHPPLLYVGYVGMAIPFAYAIAALITGRTGPAWVAVVRTWTLVAWTALTAGVVLGGWWAYEVLGWGGYWAWDPVENVSVLPWLTATALLHSIMVQKRRATLRLWNLTLAVATFCLVVFGTFLTRSGVNHTRGVCWGTRPTPHRAHRAHLRARGVLTVIPEPADQIGHRRRRGSRGGRPVNFDAGRYRGHNVVGRAFNQLKNWRGLATRYDKHVLTYRGGVVLAAALLWLSEEETRLEARRRGLEETGGLMTPAQDLMPVSGRLTHA